MASIVAAAATLVIGWIVMSVLLAIAKGMENSGSGVVRVLSFIPFFGGFSVLIQMVLFLLG